MSNNMNKSKVLLFGVSAVVLLSFSLLKLWQLLNPAEPVVEKNNQVVAPLEFDDIELVESPVMNEEQLLTEYLKDNLSRLSPRPEVLGGKFYLTELIIKESGLASIAYEDGHISLNADVQYGFQDNEPFIVDFVVTAENGAPVIVDNNAEDISSSTEAME